MLSTTKSRKAGKILLHTLFFFLLVTQICFAQWYQQNSPTTKNLNAVTFFDTNNGLAIGDSGTIVRTSNGGTSWFLVPTDVPNNLTAMSFTDDNNGWIVCDGLYSEGDSARILHTNDGGLSWNTQKTFPTSTLSDIFFIDQNNGFATGYVWEDDPNICYGCWLYSILLKTNNGGITWSQLDYDSLNVPQRIYFVDASNGWMMRGTCGNGCGGDFNKTTDGGTSWIQKGVGHFYDIQFTDFNNAVAVGIARNMDAASPLDDPMGKITKTTNGGNTWETQFIVDDFPIWFRSVFCVTEDTYVIVAHVNGGGDVLYFYWTTDGGTTWFPRPTDIEQHVNRVFFADTFTGWAVGENGVILHTTNGGVSFVEEQELAEIPTEFLLSQNYPNPFNPSTKVKYSIPPVGTQRAVSVQINVFDILGNEIETLVNEEKPAGTYEITWYAEQLPSGVYFYQLKAGEFVQTKKMLLLK